MHLVMIGGSDAGISAALRARELDPSADVSVVVADAYPNFSICGIPYYLSGEVTHWQNLAHRTGADPVRPPIGGLTGPDALGSGDGVHLLHSMGDTFAVMRTLENAAPASAVIVGAGYIGLEMADALTVRGLQVTQMEQLAEVLPTVDPQLGALVHAGLAGHGVEVLIGTTVQAVTRAVAG